MHLANLRLVSLPPAMTTVLRFSGTAGKYRNHAASATERAAASIGVTAIQLVITLREYSAENFVAKPMNNKIPSTTAHPEGQND